MAMLPGTSWLILRMIEKSASYDDGPMTTWQVVFIVALYAGLAGVVGFIAWELIFG